MKELQGYRFALDPSPVQERALRSAAGAARFAWNWGLARCIERYEAEGKWYRRSTCTSWCRDSSVRHRSDALLA
jgi:transposase